jgi:L-ribulose-5-phosphate 3-epimerase
MLLSINAWTFPAGTDARRMAESAALAGFEAVELTMGLEGLLTTLTPDDQCRQIARVFQDAGLKIASLATALFWRVNYGDPDPAVRQQAKDLTRTGLEKAAALGTDALLVVPAVVGTWNEPAPQVGYADALVRSFEMLGQLREDAEDRGVHIAIENVPSRFLLSPVEMRDLIDRVNSPWVGAYFDVGNAVAFGYPQDWISVLGRRIVRVHAKDCDLNRGALEGLACPLEEGSVNWPAVIAALRAARYEGPLTYEGPGDPAEIARRLRRILGRA